MSDMPDCLFCRIVRREIPSYGVFEDEWTYAFLDIAPVNQGHVLVIPKHHLETVLEGSSEVLHRWILSVQRVARQVCGTLQVHDFNLLQNNGKDAGQIIPHLHMHIIPRKEGDGLKHWPQGVHPTPEEFHQLAEKIRLFNGE